MELQIKKDYALENLVKDWGFIKLDTFDYCVYLKKSENSASAIQIFSDRDVFVRQRDWEWVTHIDDEILCLLYDLIQAGIVVKE